MKCDVFSLCRCVCITAGRALIPKGFVGSAVPFTGAFAGSVSKEVCLAGDVLRGRDPFYLHSAARSWLCWDASLSALLRPRRWCYCIFTSHISHSLREGG